MTLDKVPWPEKVKAAIVKAYKGTGFEDPLQQKLVEPYALAFGGERRDGEYDFKAVDWQCVIDYFNWEAIGIEAGRTDDEALTQQTFALNRAAQKKYGFSFHPYQVYHDQENGGAL